MLIHNY